MWFQRAANALQQLQKDQIEQEDEKIKKDRADILEELKEELAALDKQADGAYIDLIVYVYKTHPPKNPAHTAPDKKAILKMDDYDRKKVLQKSIVHYHPDKQDAEKYGKKWFVLCEEITKRLNIKYGCMKHVQKEDQENGTEEGKEEQKNEKGEEEAEMSESESDSEWTTESEWEPENGSGMDSEDSEMEEDESEEEDMEEEPSEEEKSDEEIPEDEDDVWDDDIDVGYYEEY